MPKVIILFLLLIVTRESSAYPCGDIVVRYWNKNIGPKYGGRAAPLYLRDSECFRVGTDLERGISGTRALPSFDDDIVQEIQASEPSDYYHYTNDVKPKDDQGFNQQEDANSNRNVSSKERKASHSPEEHIELNDESSSSKIHFDTSEFDRAIDAGRAYDSKTEGSNTLSGKIVTFIGANVMIKSLFAILIIYILLAFFSKLPRKSGNKY